MNENVKNLSRVKAILAKTDNFFEFEKEFSQYVRFQGDRRIDLTTFVIELDKDYSLWVQFSEGSFDYYSIIHNSFNGELLLYI